VRWELGAGPRERARDRTLKGTAGLCAAAGGTQPLGMGETGLVSKVSGSTVGGAVGPHV
jgi:hypothetical protein